MGAPTVMLEKLPRGDEAMAALRSLEAVMGRKASAIFCIEAGGLNSTIPIAVAATAGLPIVDGDGMGRAFPELQMVSMTMFDIHACPMAMALTGCAACPPKIARSPFRPMKAGCFSAGANAASGHP